MLRNMAHLDLYTIYSKPIIAVYTLDYRLSYYLSLKNYVALLKMRGLAPYLRSFFKSHCYANIPKYLLLIKSALL